MILGDPTIFGNLQPATQILDAMKQVIDEKKFNGYAPSVGYVEAREAVAEYSGNNFVTHKKRSKTRDFFFVVFKTAHQGIIKEISAKDVILCSGCSCSLDLCIAAIANEGQNILIPKPGFSIYRTLAEGNFSSP